MNQNQDHYAQRDSYYDPSAPKQSSQFIQQNLRARSNGEQSELQQKLKALVTQVPQGQLNPSPQLSNNNTPKHRSKTQGGNQKIQAGSYRQKLPKGLSLLGPQPEKNIGMKTLVLDLDETLVHSQFNQIKNPDFVIPVDIDGNICNIYVQKRPGVDNFLRVMSEYFELVIFTASLSKYADPLMDQMDTNRYCTSRLFREHCTYLNNVFTKDMSKLGRNQKDAIILDNSPAAYMLQPEQAVPIISWYDDQRDKQLFDLIPLLIQMSQINDCREAITRFVKNNSIDISYAKQICNILIDKEEREQLQENLVKMQIQSSENQNEIKKKEILYQIQVQKIKDQKIQIIQQKEIKNDAKVQQNTQNISQYQKPNLKIKPSNLEIAQYQSINKQDYENQTQQKNNKLKDIQKQTINDEDIQEQGQNIQEKKENKSNLVLDQKQQSTLKPLINPWVNQNQTPKNQRATDEENKTKKRYKIQQSDQEQKNVTNITNIIYNFNLNSNKQKPEQLIVHQQLNQSGRLLSVRNQETPNQTQQRRFINQTNSSNKNPDYSQKAVALPSELVSDLDNQQQLTKRRPHTGGTSQQLNLTQPIKQSDVKTQIQNDLRKTAQQSAANLNQKTKINGFKNQFINKNQSQTPNNQLNYRQQNEQKLELINQRFNIKNMTQVIKDQLPDDIKTNQLRIHYGQQKLIKGLKLNNEVRYQKDYQPSGNITTTASQKTHLFQFPFQSIGNTNPLRFRAITNQQQRSHSNDHQFVEAQGSNYNKQMLGHGRNNSDFIQNQRGYVGIDQRQQAFIKDQKLLLAENAIADQYGTSIINSQKNQVNIDDISQSQRNGVIPHAYTQINNSQKIQIGQSNIYEKLRNSYQTSNQQNENLYPQQYSSVAQGPNGSFQKSLKIGEFQKSDKISQLQGQKNLKITLTGTNVQTKNDSLDYTQFYQSQVPKTTKNIPKFLTNPENKVNSFTPMKPEMKTLQNPDEARQSLNADKQGSKNLAKN